MAIKRSPRYPRFGLDRALELIERLYDGAHQSKVDADTAAQVIGYSNSSSGAAAGALGTLRQFGLVDGMRGDMNVSDLAMRILQPLNGEERVEALHEAAFEPEVFSKVMDQFDGELPRADAPIQAFMVRQLGFSNKGAGEALAALRETFSGLPDLPTEESGPSPDAGKGHEAIDDKIIDSSPSVEAVSEPSSYSKADEIIVLPLSSDCKAEVRFVGSVTQTAYARLIKHLELLAETLEE